MMKAKLIHDFPSDADELYVWIENADGTIRELQPATIETKALHRGLVRTPFMNVGSKDFLQAIVNEAAAHGIVAAGTEDRTNELSAVRDHLEDMRRLVFDDQPRIQHIEIDPRSGLPRSG